MTGQSADALVERMVAIRPHLVAAPTFAAERASAKNVDGTVQLPVGANARLRLPVSVTIHDGRVVAAPTVLGRGLETWPELDFHRVRTSTGRLLDRDGGALDTPRDAALRATATPVFRARLGGGLSYELTADGRALAVLTAPPAADIRLAVDSSVQAAAASALGSVAGRGLVAVDAATGQVLAFAGGLTGDAAVGATARPTGSAFKIATATAALLAGRSVEDRVRCPAAAVVERRAVVNAAELDLGALSLRRAFALSCNTTFAKLGVEIGGSRVRAAAVALGFTAGLVGTDAGRVDRVSGERAAALGFGAEGVRATPAALASVAATLANDGEARPLNWEPTVGPARRAVPARVAADVIGMMRDAVTHGTAQLAAVPGFDVAAKTGTPRRTSGGVDVDDALTVAAVRVGGWNLGVAVVVLGGGSGGQTAAPLVAAFVRALDNSERP